MSNQVNNDQFKTPMMMQYLEIKKQYPDCILFFRLGDFYEMFLEDAKIGSEILDITLTARSRGKDGKIPMAGVPFHAVDSYLTKLISAGFKVAICDQVSLPDGKGLVDREVIRVITPGTNLNSKGLERKTNNYILAIDYSGSDLTIIICDISTGELSYISDTDVNLFSAKQLIDDLFVKIKPVEIIVNDSFYTNKERMSLFKNYNDLFVYCFEDWDVFSQKKDKYFDNIFQNEVLVSDNLVLVKKVCNVLLGYIKYTQKVDLKHIKIIQKFYDEQFLEMDSSTINNLELLKTLGGNKKNSFLDLIDSTRTAMGGRLLKKWLVKPLFNKKEIEKRLNIVEGLVANRELREEVASILKNITDLERTLSRLSLDFGNPRDLVSIKESLLQIINLRKIIKDHKELSNLLLIDKKINKVINLIDSYITDNPPINPKTGGFIKAGLDSKLDELNEITGNSRSWMDDFEKKERKSSGINSLKVKYNKVFGFYIEISNANLNMVPDNYQRKQTLVNAERYITSELKHHEELILTAQEQIFKIEYELFLKVVKLLLNYVVEIQALAKQVATIDCLTSFAKVSLENSFVKPNISDKNLIDIKSGRHPVIENIIGKHNFVSNDIYLDQYKQQLIIITGPNMAGKSVLMRQTALIVLMAQMGMFVPAGKAIIGLTDKIFVRSGASDAITEGLSTFMVEMVETARILKNATKKSLVIMDEIGRGTSTYDGISIAWSVAEKLVSDKKRTPKTLFATHYHELQELENNFPQKISNFYMAIEDHSDQPIFLYLFRKGIASKSFGIQVAKLAGLPTDVLSRARSLIGQFDEFPHESNLIDINSQKNKSNVDEVEAEGDNLKLKETNLLNDLLKIKPNDITPLEALIKLNELIKKYGQN